jgi:hypothetical protein
MRCRTECRVATTSSTRDAAVVAFFPQNRDETLSLLRQLSFHQRWEV